MTKIISAADCDNSPKKALLKQFNIAFAKADIAFLTAHVSDDIVWDIVADQKIAGKDQFIEYLNHMPSEQAAELSILQILSHGKEGAANGMLKMQNGKIYAFADFYLFDSAKGSKIKSITSYCIEV